MDAILVYLRDPAWWFTTVFIGIIVGIASAFLKDWLIHLTTAVPQRYQAWRDRQMQKEGEFVELIASDATRLIIANIKATRVLIHFAVISLTFIMIECFALFGGVALGNNSNLTFETLPITGQVLMILGLLIGIRAIPMSNKTVRLIKLVSRANKLYRTSNKLMETPEIWK